MILNPLCPPASERSVEKKNTMQFFDFKERYLIITFYATAMWIEKVLSLDLERMQKGGFSKCNLTHLGCIHAEGLTF